MPSVSVFVQKTQHIKEREQPEQSAGRKAAQRCNSIIHKVAESDSTQPGKVASKDRQCSTFCWDSESASHFYRGIVSQGRHRKAIWFVLKPLLRIYEYQPQKSLRQVADICGTKPAHVSLHGGWVSCHQNCAQSWTEDFCKFRLV